MIWILLVIALMFAAAWCAWKYAIEPRTGVGAKAENNAMYLIAAICGAFLLRVILAGVYKGHASDMSCFLGWANAVFEHGFSRFYTLDMFHDYPPGYMYVLYVAGSINKLFAFSGAASYVVVKLPAIICDLAAAFVIYRIAKKKFSDGVSCVIASLYLFNPAAILNCSLWGQVDSVYTIFALLMIYFITEKKMIYSYFMFAICLFIKPQAFIFTPVLIGGIVENVFLRDFSKEKLFKNLGFGLSALALVFLLALPFGIGNVFEQYKATLASYPHLTVNAFNLWGAFGQNWADLTTFASALGYTFIAAISVFAVFIIIKSKHEGKYYFAGALLAFLTYMLSVKMHDRYAFPAMVMLLAAFACVPKARGFWAYILVTASQFFNTAWVLFIYEKDINKYFRSPVIVAASFINIAVMIFIIYFAYRGYVTYTAETVTAAAAPKKAVKKTATTPRAAKKSIISSESLPAIARFDIIAMIVITAIYSCVALYDLGDMAVPETEYNLANEAVTVDLGQDYNLDKIMFYLGSYELHDGRNINFRAQSSNGDVAFTKNVTAGSVFHWEEIEPEAKARFITLSTKGKELSIKEIAVISGGSVITPVQVSPSASSTLFDEQSLVPDRQSFRNSTYFDEIYHARTAYEFIHHLSVYEWTHPPLGKAFIALGILLFGMCPFGWRIAGTVFGIIMVPIIYIFAKKLLKKSWLAVVTCLLFTFDFMHFAQTRIATIDVYVTFFIMLMYYFMYKYYSSSFYDTDFRKGLGMLALSGTAMGLGIASKWTGIYAGAGLGVLFFITLWRRYNEYRVAMRNPNGETDGISHKFMIDNFKPYTIKTLIWCVVFFAVVPIVIYCLSYIPYLGAPDQHGFKAIFDNQSAMLTYHSKTVLNSTHPYSSRWYQWIIMTRPIWYYSGTISSSVKEGISAFGNPLVWWVAIPAFMYMVYLAIRKDRNALFLVIGYLAQLVSWIPVTRLTFIYHYFPCVPFMTLMIGYGIKRLYDETVNKKMTMYAVFGYAAAVIVLFIMFYPVLSGQPCKVEYARHFLKWFDSWVLL